MSKRYQNIMVAVDGSRQSIKAFAEALDLAKDNEAHLFIVSIINKVELTHSAYAFSKIYADEKQRTEVAMLKKINDAKEFGIAEIHAIVETGDPRNLIANVIPGQENIDCYGSDRKRSYTTSTSRINRFLCRFTCPLQCIGREVIR